MSLERAALQGNLAGLERQRAELILKGQGLCTAIRTAIYPVLIEFEEMEIPQAAQQMNDLVMVSAELARVNGKIAQLKKELR